MDSVCIEKMALNIGDRNRVITRYSLARQYRYSTYIVSRLARLMNRQVAGKDWMRNAEL